MTKLTFRIRYVHTFHYQGVKKRRNPKLNIKQSPIQNWVPPKMPPRFSLNTDLTLGVNAPLKGV
jgi:hypothetical protein